MLGRPEHLVSDRPPPAGVNRFGDLVCPHRGVNVMCPPGGVLVPGHGESPACRKPWFVRTGTARIANRRWVEAIVKRRRRGEAVRRLYPQCQRPPVCHPLFNRN
jgi:hypothetical protein